MTEDQKDFVVELIRNTVEYLHKQEVLLIQLAGSIEASKKEPKPTPAEKTAEEVQKFYKDLKEQDPDYQYPFPWGRRLGKKADDYKPGLTHIVSEAAPTNVVGEPCITPIRDAMVHGIPVSKDEPPRGSWE
jgi:hypothetical protein